MHAAVWRDVVRIVSTAIEAARGEESRTPRSRWRGTRSMRRRSRRRRPASAGSTRPATRAHPVASLPHRPDGVDDPPCGQAVAAGGLGVPGGASAERAALRQQPGAGCRWIAPSTPRPRAGSRWRRSRWRRPPAGDVPGDHLDGDGSNHGLPLARRRGPGKNPINVITRVALLADPTAGIAGSRWPGAVDATRPHGDTTGKGAR